MGPEPIFAIIDYEDPYVQPLLLAALQEHLPPDLLHLVSDVSSLPPEGARLLQWRQYESIDFDRLTSNPATSLANSYIIRKALIRKHFLAATVSHWLTKHPTSPLRHHVQPSVEFELDYAEFLDDALLEAFELKESWARNSALGPGSDATEWWILKPGMSERGQGIRLFSSEAELREIFEGWDPTSSDEDDDEADDDDGEEGGEEAAPASTSIMTSHLRHFTAQPYIPRPLLLPPPHPSANRKFHVRTYVLAFGALRVFVYRPMLALFAASPYSRPSSSAPNDDLSAHLTNTCLQTGEREGSVEAFWALPGEVGGGTEGVDWRESVFGQICEITGEVFEAAVRSMGVHFQALPNGFEVFGVDFLVDEGGKAWLLEVNAFPDFAQTGEGLRGVVEGLLGEVVEVGVKPFFGVEEGTRERERGEGGLVLVREVDLGRR